MTTLWFLAACQQFASVDDACPNDVARGGGSDAAHDFVARVACHRRLAGLNPATLDPNVNQAVEAHAAYLAATDVLAGAQGISFSLEAPDKEGFTGRTSADRLVASGFLSSAVYEEYTLLDRLVERSPELSVAEQVDALIADPAWRDVLLTPDWEAAGYAEATDPTLGRFAYVNVVARFPTGIHSRKPLVWPVDGQQEVPPAWGAAGYPISFTLGSLEPLPVKANPLEVRISSSRIDGPGGTVEHEALLPGPYPAGEMRTTAAVVPGAPLLANADYTVEVTVAWSSGERVMSSAFRTGPAEPATTATGETGGTGATGETGAPPTPATGETADTGP